MRKLSNKGNGIISQSDLKRRSVKILYCVLILICSIITIASIAPILWVFLASFKDIKEFTLNPTLLPNKFDFSKFIKTWNDLKFY